MESKSAEAALGSELRLWFSHGSVHALRRIEIHDAPPAESYHLQVSTGNRHNIIQYLRHIHK